MRPSSFLPGWFQLSDRRFDGIGTSERPASRVSLVEPLEGRRLLSGGDIVLQWNELLLQSLSNQPARVPFARNMALVHTAMFDAVNAIERSFEPYAAEGIRASRGASAEAAAAQAARDTLTALYPSRQAVFDMALAENLAEIAPGRANQGVAVGKEVARQLLALRADDGAAAIVTYAPPNNDPGQWQPTPPNNAAATNVHVSLITPFAVESSEQFRPGPPPALTSAEYADDLNEVKTLGVANNSTRTPDQTLVAELWRQPLVNHVVWNRVAQDMVADANLGLAKTARLFAMLDMAINDGLQTSNGSKFHYGLWRPVTAIQRAAEDGNPATDPDPLWRTLHPTTPPYPTYAGNASTIGAASATVLAGVFGDDVAFDVDWSRYGFSGVTRTYEGFWAAADEMADSRIYGGIHFRFDSVAGQQIGADVGGHILDNLLRPRDASAPLPAGPVNATASPAQVPAATGGAGLFSGVSIGGLLQQSGLVGDPGAI